MQFNLHCPYSDLTGSDLTLTLGSTFNGTFDKQKITTAQVLKRRAQLYLDDGDGFLIGKNCVLGVRVIRPAFDAGFDSKPENMILFVGYSDGRHVISLVQLRSLACINWAIEPNCDSNWKALVPWHNYFNVLEDIDLLVAIYLKNWLLDFCGFKFQSTTLKHSWQQLHSQLNSTSSLSLFKLRTTKHNQSEKNIRQRPPGGLVQIVFFSI